MERKMLNRIKIVLAEKDKTNKWLAEQLDKDPAMVSKWVTNKTQPSIRRQPRGGSGYNRTHNTKRLRGKTNG